MDVNAFMLLMLVSQFNIIHSAHVSGIITKNMTFFYRKLPVAPSLRATIEFSVSYPVSSMKGERPWPLMGIYTAYPKINIENRCSKIIYGQLHNENLHPFLRIPEYRTTTCEMSGGDTVNCRGRVTVQDFIPRNFSLSFGFECDSSMNSLKGLKYNITFSNQSNKTNVCKDHIDHVNQRGQGVCGGFYRQMSLPNLVGDGQLDKIRNYLMVVEAYEMTMLSYEKCHQHLVEILCHLMLPECDPFTQQVIHPCRETCWALLDACWQTWLSIEAIILRQKFGRKMDDVSGVDCDYLPSLYGDIPCFYKPVTCDSPPYVTNSTVMVNATQKDVYQLHDVVQYACVNDTFAMTGTDSITCMYSGQWSTAPPKCFPVNNSGIKSIYFLLPVISVLLLVLFVFIIITYKRKTSPDLIEERIELDNTLVLLTDNDEPLLPSKRQQESTLSLDSLPSLKRNREFDAFVLYHFDSDDDFVLNVLLPELEENRDFKLCIHNRDFTPGRDIQDNIEEAIEGSNSAIIVMSQGFVDSMWCKEEFTHCYIENMKDAAFNLIVIMMQPADSLDNISPYMQTYFDTKTYLKENDPQLFTKIATNLHDARKPENDDIDNASG